MNAHTLTMSKMNIAHECAYGFRTDVETFPRPAGAPALKGLAVHHLVECAGRGTKPDLSTYNPTIAAEAQAVFDGPLSGFVASRKWTACEIGVRFDAENDTCAAGPRRGEPGYEADRQMILPGTLDLVFVEGRVAWVWDVKTGKMPEDREQLYAQGVAVSRLYGLDEVHVGYARALKTKLQADDMERLDADRLDEESGRIARVLRRLPAAEPPRPAPEGKACWKCEARPACPAFGAAKAEHQMAELEAGGFFG